MLFVWSQLWRLTDALTARAQQARHAQVGQGLVEYALIIAVVAVVAVAALALLGGKVGDTFSNIINQLNLPGAGE